MSTIHLRIEVDAVGYSNEHVAVCDAVILGHAHADAVASRVDHGLEVAGGVNPIVDSAPGGVGRAGKHSEVVAEAVGVSGIGSGLPLPVLVAASFNCCERIQFGCKELEVFSTERNIGKRIGFHAP